MRIAVLALFCFGAFAEDSRRTTVAAFAEPCPPGSARPCVSTPPLNVSSQDTAPPNVLTNEGVITLVRAGFSDDFILEMIYQKQTQFDTSADALARLASSGVSTRVVRYMTVNDRKEAVPEFPRTTPTFVPVRVDAGGIPLNNPAAQVYSSAAPSAVSASYGAVLTTGAVFPGFRFRIPAVYASPVYPAYYTHSWWSGTKWLSYWP